MHQDYVKRIVISMTTPNMPGCSPAKLSDVWVDVLRLEYHDIDHDSTGRMVLFGEGHALEILKFLKKHEDSEVTEVIAHCEAGISRSAAVAKFVAYIYGLEFPESYSLYNKRVFSTLLSLHGKCLYGEGPIACSELPGHCK